MNNVTMKSRDTVSGKFGNCYISLNMDKNGNYSENVNRYLFMQVTNVKAKVDFDIADISIMGQSGMGHKTVGWKGSGTATFHYNTSMFAKIMEYFKKTGKEMRFTMQVTNSDSSSSAGEQVTILKDCLLSGATIANIDSGTNDLTDDISFTFDDYSISTPFKVLDGMAVSN